MRKVIVGAEKLVINQHKQASTVFVFAGDLGTGTAKLAFSNGEGGLVDVTDGEIAVPSTFSLLHGVGNYPVVVADGVTRLVVISHGG